MWRIKMRFGKRAAPLVGAAVLLGLAVAPVAVSAQSTSSGGLSPDPQVITSGYESPDDLRNDAVRNATGEQYSAWLVESSRFVGVAFGGFMPDHAGPDAEGKEQIIDFPVNVGIIKGKDGKITLYDSGWMQQDYIFRWNAGCCATPLRDEMIAMGLNPDDVTRIVIGHGHWDHAGQLDQFQNGVLYVQREELRAIDWALNYPDPRIGAWNTMALGPQNPNGTYNNTYGAQLLQVNTPVGQLVFGSDTYSSWEGIRDWNVANVQQTDTVQQFPAYEKCYLLTGTPTDKTPQGCIAAHERLSYSA